jgi:hypothetical protein
LDTAPGKREQVLKILESAKHYLWHGNVVRAQEQMQGLHSHLDNEEIEGDNGRKMRKGLDEFDTYIAANQARIPNYGTRWRNEEAIATGFVEWAVNQIVSKRFAKRQQMQWPKKGAHLLLQTRTWVLDDRLEETFRKWYPDSGGSKLKPKRRPPAPTFLCSPFSDVLPEGSCRVFFGVSFAPQALPSWPLRMPWLCNSRRARRKRSVCIADSKR